jgi:hypothetical protein
VAAETEDSAAVALECDLEAKLVPAPHLLDEPLVARKGEQPLRPQAASGQACGERITHGNAFGARRFTHYYRTFPLDPRFSPHMQNMTVSVGLAVARALPVGALAKPHPDQAEKRAATAECRRNAFGQCVSTKAKAKEHAADALDAQQASEFKNAAKECDNERGDTDAQS